MNLQGRNVSFQAPPKQGEGVAFLRRELRQLDFLIRAMDERNLASTISLITGQNE
jgi:hypothetical protein